mgnify:CR=1 FL=1
MSFQFPANPVDGDIIIQPQPDGQFIKGTYNSITNTWAVGELPEEPGVPGPEGPKGDQGDKGNPGKGVNVSGVVSTESALPEPNNATLQFWIVDDTNTLYYSNGFEWTNLGSPIEGPQGDPGTDGTNGTNGSNGLPGLGWTGTTIIDETDQDPPNYQISFNSNDNLGFVTENLIGPPGQVGEIPLASATRLGGIKIGRGLNIKPDGTASAGETNVDLETVPLTPEGTVYNYSYALNFNASYINWADNQRDEATGYRSGATSLQTGNMSVPPTSDGGIVYYFTGSSVGTNYRPNNPQAGQQWTCYANLTGVVTVDGADWVSGSDRLGTTITHNFSVGSEARRGSTQTTTKIGQLTWPEGTTSLNWTQTVSLLNFQRCFVDYGRGRIVVVPYRNNADDPQTFTELQTKLGIDVPYSDVEDTPDAPPSDEEELEQNTELLIQSLVGTLNSIDAIVIQTYPPGTDEYTLLMSTRQELLDLQTAAGTYQDVNREYERLVDIIAPLLQYSFRFNSVS